MISLILNRFRLIDQGRVRWPATLATRLDSWAEVRRQRRRLASLSDAMLRDIGLGRGDVEREASRPFWDLPDGGPSRWR